MNSHNTSITTLAGGCFWCLEAVYEQVNGVQSVISGYSGGHVANPSYYEVCSETTGHAEVVQVTFDPDVISFREILQVFFGIHDPTTLNRQGYDVGARYRSAIFYHDEEQKTTAENLIAELSDEGIWRDPIVTEVTEFSGFYMAEPEHQEFYRSNPYQPYCQVVISPKVAKFRKEHVDKLKKVPAS